LNVVKAGRDAGLGARQNRPGHLRFAALFTAYVLIGVRHEERDLARTFGDRYRRYQAEVPMLLPLPFPSKLNGWRRRSASS
jgi:protein-S-isoprenylcysteine O-methyltransferase Ste14